MRLIHGLISILALGAGFPLAATPQGDTQNELSSYMDARVRANDFSGAVLVSLGRERLLLRGYGLANREWTIPNAPTTRFRLGSLTKGFTAALIMQLNERGRIDLNAGICSYLS